MVAVEEGQGRERDRPAEIACRRPEFCPRSDLRHGEEQPERQEDLDLARQVAGDDRAGQQRSAAPVDHLEVDDALARRGALALQLEVDEVEVPEQEGQEQHDCDRHRAGSAVQERQAEHEEEQDGRQHPEQEVDQEGDEPLAMVGDIDLQRHPLRRNDLAPVAGDAVEQTVDAVKSLGHGVRVCRSRGNRRSTARRSRCRSQAARASRR